MEREKFLPIGSIVLLKEAEKKLMITGFLPINTESGEEERFDYSGCLYPEGILTFDETLLFNHDQIDKIIALGYEDDDEKEFKNNLNEFLRNPEAFEIDEEEIPEESEPEEISEEVGEIKVKEDEEETDESEESEPEERELTLLEKLRIERSKEKEDE